MPDPKPTAAEVVTTLDLAAARAGLAEAQRQLDALTGTLDEDLALTWQRLEWMALALSTTARAMKLRASKERAPYPELWAPYVERSSLVPR